MRQLVLHHVDHAERVLGVPRQDQMAHQDTAFEQAVFIHDERTGLAEHFPDRGKGDGGQVRCEG